MDKIKLIEKNLKDFFYEKTDVLAISSGFIKRKRKLKDLCFAKALIMAVPAYADENPNRLTLTYCFQKEFHSNFHKRGRK